MSDGRRIILLGSTGSIGRDTIDVVTHLRREGLADLPVIGLAAGRNVELLAEQALKVGAEAVAIATEDGDVRYRGPGRVYTGADAAAALVRDLARPGDIVVAAIVGAAGIDGVMAAIEQGCRIALANKETLVAAGGLVMPAAAQAGVDIIPVDSEHSAIAQCLVGARDRDVERLVLTASGGPFRGKSRGDIASATVDEALAHPTWSMGRKITIDSATLANKALEIIEAHWLFGLPASRIQAVVHPQSIIHGFVEFVDGSVLAQAGPPDMRTPIQYAITWPDRCAGCSRRMDWSAMGSLEFEDIDHDTFPMIQLAWRAIEAGGTSGAILNAANEAAVEAFLDGAVRFGDIFDLVAEACRLCTVTPTVTRASIADADMEARRFVQSRIPVTRLN